MQKRLQGGEPNVPGKLIRNTFGAAIVGPILKDRLHYFANFEMHRTAEAVRQTETVPNAMFRQGYISYPYQTGSGLATETLTPEMFAQLDPHCSGLGTCPWGPGDNPNILQVFNSYPMPNGPGGDNYNTASYTTTAWPTPGKIWIRLPTPA